MPKYLLTLLLAAALAGCGQQSNGESAAQPPAAQATTAAEEQAAETAPTPMADTAATSEPAATPAAPVDATVPAPAVATAESTGQAGVPLEELQIATELVTDDLNQPIYATGAGDGSNRLFVVEKPGRVRIVRDGQAQAGAFLDITDRVGAQGSEQGLLSVAFHPNFGENGQLYVNYTDRNGDTVVSRFQASGDTADPASETVLLQIDQPYPNHNGGLVKFGPDGYLYIGMGDGGSAGDPQSNGQNPQALLGKMLRIDVDGGEPYGTPADNPWAGGGEGSPEVWAIGLRNPWRFSFDRATGDLYIADVGQNAVEEISFQQAGAGAGANYGWNVTEGSSCYRGNCDPAAFVPPIGEYSHEFGCSVTGGYVYRGAAFPGMQGTYLFGDYCSGIIWGLQNNGGSWTQRELLQSGLRISSFGEDDAGELYITNLDDNGLYRVTVR